MLHSARGNLQSATVISKTDQVLVGAELSVIGYRYLSLFLDYAKGNETGLLVVPSFLPVSGGDLYQYGVWTPTTGVNAFQAGSFKMTASGKYYFVIDIAGQEFVKITQGGSNNDGTPTGTLAAKYLLTGN